MKSPDDAHFLEWDKNPEPNTAPLDGRVILEETGYLWHSDNCPEAWLAFHGELSDIEQ